MLNKLLHPRFEWLYLAVRSTYNFMKNCSLWNRALLKENSFELSGNEDESWFVTFTSKFEDDYMKLLRVKK